MKKYNNIGIIGSGAWGTTLGLVSIRAGLNPLIWAYEADVAKEINQNHINPYLTGIDLSPKLSATTQLSNFSKMDVLLFTTPSQYLRGVCIELNKHISNIPIVLCAKGIEKNSGKLLSEVVFDIIPRSSLGILSGPTLANEVAQGLPAAVTLASKDSSLVDNLSHSLGTPTFRPYKSSDVIGAQIGGAMKNVLAIACGIVTGKGLGDSARAALISRGMTEMLRLGLALGGKRETLMGLSGLGDLVLTCSSIDSRNMSLGLALGKGQKLEDILGSRNSIAEGLETSAAIKMLSERISIEMPISSAVNSILHNNIPIDEAILGLLERPFKGENDN